MSFRDSFYYPIIFMVIITIFFVGILSFYYRYNEKKIEDYRQESFQKQVLSLFADTLSALINLTQEHFIKDELSLSNYKRYIQSKDIISEKIKNINKKYYVCKVDNKIIGYAYDITGSGLWGTMKGLLAVDSEYRKIINFFIYEQMETPGLGARVEEEWFKKQFRGKSTSLIVAPKGIKLISENAKPRENEIKQITGATITSKSVITMLNQTVKVLSTIR